MSISRRIIDKQNSEYWIERIKKPDADDVFKIGRINEDVSIAELQGEYARKIYFLLIQQARIEKKPEHKISDHYLHGICCHESVYYVAVEQHKKQPQQLVLVNEELLDFETEIGDLRNMLHQHGLPLINEVVKNGLIFSSILHSRLIVCLDNDEPVVFEKQNYSKPYRLVGIGKSNEDYPRKRQKKNYYAPVDYDVITS
jgi:hypothetical protein